MNILQLRLDRLALHLLRVALGHIPHDLALNLARWRLGNLVDKL